MFCNVMQRRFINGTNGTDKWASRCNTIKYMTHANIHGDICALAPTRKQCTSVGFVTNHKGRQTWNLGLVSVVSMKFDIFRVL